LFGESIDRHEKITYHVRLFIHRIGR